MTNVNNLRGWTQLHVELSVQISWPGILGELCEYFNRMDLHYFGSTTVSVLLFFPKVDNLHNLLHIANPKILRLTNFGGKHINPLTKVNYPHMFEYIKKLTQNRFIYQEKFYTLHGEDCGVIILLLKRQQCEIFTSGFFTKRTYLAPKSKFILNIILNSSWYSNPKLRQCTLQLRSMYNFFVVASFVTAGKSTSVVYFTYSMRK
jgi:hypothetical protein